MLPAQNLDIDVLVVVPVERRNRPRVANPQVDGLGALLKGYACPGYVRLDVSKQGHIFVPEVVVFFQRQSAMRSP